MRILILYHENVSRRFPEHYRLPFLRYLKDWGHEIRFVGFRDDISQPLLDHETAFLPKRRAKTVLHIPGEVFGNHKDLKSVIRHFNHQGFVPEAVISFNYPALIQMGRRISKQHQIPHFVHIGHLMAEELKEMEALVQKVRGAAALMVRKRQLHDASQVWVMSEEMRHYFSGSVGRERLKVWPSAVSTDRHPDEYRRKVTEIRAQLGLAEDARVMIYIGTLARSRDLGFVLRVVKRVVEALPEARMVFLGYSPESEDLSLLQEQSRALGVNQYVLFHPPVPEDELPFYIKIAEVGLSPFKPTFILRHNSPLKLMEYMKAGIPVVGTNIPDQKEVIESSGGGFLTDWDDAAYSRAIMRMLSMSSEDRIDMGLRGYAWVRENRDIKKLTKELESWVREKTPLLNNNIR